MSTGFTANIQKENRLYREFREIEAEYKTASGALLKAEGIKGWLLDNQIPIHTKLELQLEKEREEFEKVNKKYHDCKDELDSLRNVIGNPGNLRYVLHDIMLEHSLSTYKLAQQLQCSEKDIANLFKRGYIEDTYYYAICEKFDLDSERYSFYCDTPENSKKPSA